MMIPYTADQKISGAYLLKNIIGGGLIIPGEDGIVLEDGVHKIRDLSFSEELRFENGMTEDLRALTENVVRLFYFVEEDPSFYVPLEKIGSALRPYIHYEDLTGMTLLMLFSLPLITLISVRDHYRVRCDSLIRENLPDAEELLIHMVKRCLAFTKETAASVEMEETLEKEYDTVSLEGGFSLTRETGGKEDLSQRERNVRKNFEEEMLRISEVLKRLDESSEETERLNEYVNGTWKEAEGQQVLLSLPEAFQKTETEDDEETVFTSRVSSDIILLHPFEDREFMPVRFLKTEKEEDGEFLSFLRVQTPGGVQPMEIRIRCAVKENRQLIIQLTDRIIRSMRWLQR